MECIACVEKILRDLRDVCLSASLRNELKNNICLSEMEEWKIKKNKIKSIIGVDVVVVAAAIDDKTYACFRWFILFNSNNGDAQYFFEKNCFELILDFYFF